MSLSCRVWMLDVGVCVTFALCALTSFQGWFGTPSETVWMAAGGRGVNWRFVSKKIEPNWHADPKTCCGFHFSFHPSANILSLSLSLQFPSLLYLLSLRLSITSFLPLLTLLLRIYTPSHLSPFSLYLSHHHSPPPALSLWIIHQCFSELLSACLPTVISTGTLSGTIPTSAGN